MLNYLNWISESTTFSNNCRMLSVKPLRETSDDLTHIITIIVQREPWDISLLQKLLHCYRAWVDYAVRGEEISIEVLFPYLNVSIIELIQETSQKYSL
jgi:hypothetical protein